MIRSRHYALPSHTLLLAFEAAARCGSVKAAAAELNVTPPAVSQNIKALEEATGLQLFERGHRQLTLTADGEELMHVLGASFSEISTTLDRLARRHAQPTVTLGTLVAISSLWLMPRMNVFSRSHPDIRVNHVTSQEGVSLPFSELDLWVQYGSETGPDEVAEKLFTDRIFPVCSAEFAERHKGAHVADLPDLPLINLSVQDRWTRWSDWLSTLGAKGPTVDGPSVNNYMIALEMAQAGRGVALGWEKLIAPLIEAGRLVRLVEESVPSPEGVYLVWSKRRPLRREGVLVRDWILSHADREHFD